MTYWHRYADLDAAVRVGEVQWESIFGTTFPGYYALFAERHMHEFGTTKEMLAAVAVKAGRGGYSSAI